MTVEALCTKLKIPLSEKHPAPPLATPGLTSGYSNGQTISQGKVLPDGPQLHLFFQLCCLPRQSSSPAAFE
ncbi:Zinc finger MYM-type protein 1 [Caligus rogercresseyi]|uniref:Zinc finger MYM-type protein 1 n=1 Tax=Caligus rogercresseyi TaxID=217165 RepID=A0A7T8HMN7_CALRO|nr:Zinc finger MYM-type protein 1 [Caligus rogercresseyi]